MKLLNDPLAGKPWPTREIYPEDADYLEHAVGIDLETEMQDLVKFWHENIPENTGLSLQVEIDALVAEHKYEKPEFKMPGWLQEARDVHGHPLRPAKQLEDPQPGLRRLR